MKVLPNPLHPWEVNAHIELTSADGTVKQLTCLRSTAEILKTLSDATTADDPAQLDLHTKVYVNAVAGQDLAKGQEQCHVMAEGKLKEVAWLLTAASAHPQIVASEFARMCEIFCASSALKGAIITLVFGDAMPAGFGYTTGYAELTLADIGVLGTAAQAQAEMFKDEMRKKFPLVRFADDSEKSRIILPGQ